MKSSSGFTLLIALMLGISAFAMAWLIQSQKESQSFAQKVSSLENDTRANLAWMRKELSLTEEEFTRECALHDAHLIEYRQLCAEMNTARERLKQALEDGNGLSAEDQNAIHDYELHFEAAERAAINHVKKAAAAMNPKAGQAYLKRMLPHLLPEHDLLFKTTAQTRNTP